MFYYEKVFKALNKAKVDYVVFGGVAAILYGVQRTTGDLDIMIKMSPENIDKVFKVFKKLGFTPKVPVTAEQFKLEKNRKLWEKEKNMQVFSFVNLKDPIELVDIFIKDYLKYENVRKKFIKVESIKIPTISVEQLKYLKKIAGREKDFADIQEIDRLRKITK